MRADVAAPTGPITLSYRPARQNHDGDDVPRLIVGAVPIDAEDAGMRTFRRLPGSDDIASARRRRRFSGRVTVVPEIASGLFVDSILIACR